MGQKNEKMFWILGGKKTSKLKIILENLKILESLMPVGLIRNEDPNSN